MSEIAKRLRERRGQLWEQAKELADRAADENREFSADEQGQWDALNEQISQTDSRIKSALDVEQRQKDNDDAFAKLENKPVDRGSGHQEDSDLRSFLRGEGPRTYDVAPSGRVNFRDLMTSGGGSNTVPTNFYDRLVAHLIETASIMQAGVTTLNTSSGETIQVPKTTAHSSAGIITEGQQITESDPTFGQVSLGAYKYGTLIQVSRELLSDSGVDLEGYLAMQTGRALGNSFGAHAINGTGTSQPSGVVSDATVGVTGADAVGGAPSADNLIDLYYSVIAPYRQSSACFWMMNDSTVAAVRKLRDDSGGEGTGQYLWQPSLSQGSPDMLLGKPVITDPNMPEIGNGANSIIFGDFSQYFVRLAGGLRFERSEDFAFNTDLVTFRALQRMDGALVDLTGALKLFQGGGTTA